MDEREKAELAALKGLVEHAGWLVLVRTTEDRLKAFQDGCPFNIKDEADLHYYRGVVSTLLDLLALPDKIRAAEEEEAV